MNEKEGKHIDKLIEKAMRSSVLETPSLGFSKNVMSQVNTGYKPVLVENNPLIPKVVWVAIAIFVLAITIYAFYGMNSTNTGWFSNLDFSFLSNNKITKPLTGMKVSKTFTYAILLFGMMLCIQIPILKSHFNRRFQS